MNYEDKEIFQVDLISEYFKFFKQKFNFVRVFNKLNNSKVVLLIKKNLFEKLELIFGDYIILNNWEEIDFDLILNENVDEIDHIKEYIEELNSFLNNKKNIFKYYLINNPQDILVKKNKFSFLNYYINFNSIKNHSEEIILGRPISFNNSELKLNKVQIDCMKKKELALIDQSLNFNELDHTNDIHCEDEKYLDSQLKDDQVSIFFVHTSKNLFSNPKYEDIFKNKNKKDNLYIFFNLTPAFLYGKLLGYYFTSRSYLKVIKEKIDITNQNCERNEVNEEIGEVNLKRNFNKVANINYSENSDQKISLFFYSKINKVFLWFHYHQAKQKNMISSNFFYLYHSIFSFFYCYLNSGDNYNFLLSKISEQLPLINNSYQLQSPIFKGKKYQENFLNKLNYYNLLLPFLFSSYLAVDFYEVRGAESEIYWDNFFEITFAFEIMEKIKIKLSNFQSSKGLGNEIYSIPLYLKSLFAEDLEFDFILQNPEYNISKIDQTSPDSITSSYKHHLVLCKIIEVNLLNGVVEIIVGDLNSIQFDSSEKYEHEKNIIKLYFIDYTNNFFINENKENSFFNSFLNVDFFYSNFFNTIFNFLLNKHIILLDPLVYIEFNKTGSFINYFLISSIENLFVIVTGLENDQEIINLSKYTYKSNKCVLSSTPSALYNFKIFSSLKSISRSLYSLYDDIYKNNILKNVYLSIRKILSTSFSSLINVVKSSKIIGKVQSVQFLENENVYLIYLRDLESYDQISFYLNYHHIVNMGKNIIKYKLKENNFSCENNFFYQIIGSIIIVENCFIYSSESKYYLKSIENTKISPIGLVSSTEIFKQTKYFFEKCSIFHKSENYLLPSTSSYTLFELNLKFIKMLPTSTKYFINQNISTIKIGSNNFSLPKSLKTNYNQLDPLFFQLISFSSKIYKFYDLNCNIICKSCSQKALITCFNQFYNVLCVKCDERTQYNTEIITQFIEYEKMNLNKSILSDENELSQKFIPLKNKFKIDYRCSIELTDGSGSFLATLNIEQLNELFSIKKIINLQWNMIKLVIFDKLLNFSSNNNPQNNCFYFNNKQFYEQFINNAHQLNNTFLEKNFIFSSIINYNSIKHFENQDFFKNPFFSIYLFFISFLKNNYLFKFYGKQYKLLSNSKFIY